MSLPRVATIQDISGVGRCSLTAAIPILSAMGVQACPLPTAVLSNQTAFESYAAISLTDQLARSVAEWQKQKLRFDAVCTGFFMDTAQASIAGEFIDYAKKEGAIILVDPVMGDDGSLYPIFGEEMRKSMRSLVRKADVITPNLTEACLLAGIPYPGGLRGLASAAEIAQPVRKIAGELSGIGPHTVVITGVRAGDFIYNVAYDARADNLTSVGNRRVGGTYSGTGDIFSSILCGALARGDDIPTAMELARQLFEKALPLSVAQNTDPREGIAFERFLNILFKE